MDDFNESALKKANTASQGQPHYQSKIEDADNPYVFPGPEDAGDGEGLKYSGEVSTAPDTMVTPYPPVKSDGVRDFNA